MHLYNVISQFISRCQGSSNIRMSKILFAFDFDQTLIDVNVDYWFIDLAATGKSYRRSGNACWMDYMQEMFTVIKSRGYGKEGILAGMGSIKITPPV